MVNTLVMELLCKRCDAWKKGKGFSMTNTFVHTFAAHTFDWTKTIALANAQARHEFETTVLNGDGLSDDQLKQHALDFEQRFKRALEAARRNRRDPEPMFSRRCGTGPVARPLVCCATSRQANPFARITTRCSRLPSRRRS